MAFVLTGILNAQTNVTYQTSSDIFLNPERGFYTQVDSKTETSSLSASTLSSIKLKNQSLILRMYYLKAFKSTDLSEKQLATINNDFAALRKAGMKCILRFAYSEKETEADAPLSIIQRHLDQLEPILRTNSDVIAFMQAGFIGAWGEWYYSSNKLNNTNSRRAVLTKILQVLPKNIMVQVRTPNYKKLIFGISNPISPSEAFSQTDIARTGHHNDCFLADMTDYGTYSDTTSDKLFLSRDAMYVPVGGETCAPSSFSECGNTLYQMNRLHWTFVNSGYHGTVISGWKKYGCYDIIQKKLGYNFELLVGTFSDSVNPGGTLSFNLKLANTGFASLYNERNVELILRSDKDTFFVKLPVDPRLWASGDTVNLKYETGIPSDLPEGNYSLLLNLPDANASLYFNPAYSVRTNNFGTWEPSTGYNNLNAAINISSSNIASNYEGDLFFQRLRKLTGVEKKLREDSGVNTSVSNYPNPFNNSTKIVYSVEKAGNVTLRIFNSLGQEVCKLLDNVKDVGRHEINFNSDNLTSGLYIILLKTNQKIVTSKMLLLK